MAFPLLLDLHALGIPGKHVLIDVLHCSLVHAVFAQGVADMRRLVHLSAGCQPLAELVELYIGGAIGAVALKVQAGTAALKGEAVIPGGKSRH